MTFMKGKFLKKNKEGFTLVEVMVASILLLIIAAVVINVTMFATVNMGRFGGIDDLTAIIEHLYSLGPLTGEAIKSQVESLSDAFFIDGEDENKYRGHKINYCLKAFPREENCRGHVLRLIIFNNRREISCFLSAYIRGEDG